MLPASALHRPAGRPPAPRQKLPEISPIFKADTVTLHVSGKQRRRDDTTSAFCGPARLRLPCPPFAIAHHPGFTYCFFHSSALIGLSEMPYTALICTLCVNKPRCLPSDTSAACLSCIFTRSAPLACWLTSAIASSVALSRSSVGTIVTPGTMTLRRGFGANLDAEAAAGAGTVLDDDFLAERVRQPLAAKAGDD